MIDVGDPDRDTRGSPPRPRDCPRFRYPFHRNRSDVGRAPQAFEEVVGDARRPLRLAVDVDPERLGLDQSALASVDADPHLAPPVRGARTPAPQPQHVLELDRLDQVDHRAADDPQRVGLLEAHLPQLILTDVLDVPGGRVEPQPALRSMSPTRSGHSRSKTSGCGSGTGIIDLRQARLAPRSRSSSVPDHRCTQPEWPDPIATKRRDPASCQQCEPSLRNAGRLG